VEQRQERGYRRHGQRSYGGKWKRWLLIYLGTAAVIYAIVYLVFFHHGGGGGGGGYFVLVLPAARAPYAALRRRPRG